MPSARCAINRQFPWSLAQLIYPRPHWHPLPLLIVHAEVEVHWSSARHLPRDTPVPCRKEVGSAKIAVCVPTISGQISVLCCSFSRIMSANARLRRAQALAMRWDSSLAIDNKGLPFVPNLSIINI